MVNIINFIQNVYFVHTTYKQNDIIALERFNHMNMVNILPTDPIIPWHRFYVNLGSQKYFYPLCSRRGGGVFARNLLIVNLQPWSLLFSFISAGETGKNTYIAYMLLCLYQLTLLSPRSSREPNPFAIIVMVFYLNTCT